MNHTGDTFVNDTLVAVSPILMVGMIEKISMKLKRN